MLRPRPSPRTTTPDSGDGDGHRVEGALDDDDALRAEEEQRAPESVEIAIPPGPRLGDVVIEAEKSMLSFFHGSQAQNLTQHCT